MDYLVLLGCTAILIGTGLYVMYPLLVPRRQADILATEARKKQLLERREQLYTAIKELEFDQALGKLPEEDYRRLRRPLEAEAMGVMQQLDQGNGQVDTEGLVASIEREVLALRQRPDPKTNCASCGSARQADDRFCSKCGERFGGVADR